MKTIDSKYNGCLYFAANALARKIEKLAIESWKPLDLSPSHAYLLMLVLEEPGLQPGCIANHLQLSPSTITRLIEKLEEKGLSVTVINHAFANHVDVETLKLELTKTNHHLVTVEDHQVKGGLGAYVTHELSLAGVEFKVKSLGIKGEFGQSAYKADQLYARFDLSSSGIAKAYHTLS
jgi:DNA-binding transcriptional regulator LsrR (DeoR family)